MYNSKDDVLVCKVSKTWYDILDTEYIISGSMAGCCWELGNQNNVSDLDPGTLVLFITEQRDKDGYFRILGGGFLLDFHNKSVKDVWDIYGVRCGASSYDDFLKDVIAKGGNENSILNVVRTINVFIFDERESVRIPKAIEDFFVNGSRFVFKYDSPHGKFLVQQTLKARSPHIEKLGANWQGMFYMASHSNSSAFFAHFEAKVFATYDYKCAITQSNVRPVLEVAHIKPLYDDEFQSIRNGILMRSDLHKLFKGGYITLDYVSEDDIRVVVSKRFKSIWSDEYLQYDGVKIYLPEDKDKRPKKKFIDWHKAYCYENWLNIGGSHT